MMEIERRYTPGKVSIEKREDHDPVIRGYAAVFDTLSENLGGFREKIDPGAFSDVLDDDVRGLFNHDSNLIIGRTKAGTLKIAQDSKGLIYEAEPPDTQIGRDLVVSIERGDVDQSSFAFTVDQDKFEEDDDGRIIRTIIKVKRLYDVSPVTYPAYPDASVGLRGLEQFLKNKNPDRGNVYAERLALCRMRLKELGAS